MSSRVNNCRCCEGLAREIAQLEEMIERMDNRIQDLEEKLKEMRDALAGLNPEAIPGLVREVQGFVELANKGDFYEAKQRLASALAAAKEAK